MKDGKKLILIADDEKEIRDVVSLLLTGDGYSVELAEDGESAASSASADIDLYILDVNMPKLAQETNRLVFQDVVLDLDNQSIIKNGESIALTYTEFKILELLASHKKKIYSLENIYQSIWDDNAVGDSAIMVHIKNIRKKLGDNSRNPTYIKTAWGRGYYID